jgi:hypothetical protein
VKRYVDWVKNCVSVSSKKSAGFADKKSSGGLTNTHRRWSRGIIWTKTRQRARRTWISSVRSSRGGHGVDLDEVPSSRVLWQREATISAHRVTSGK